MLLGHWLQTTIILQTWAATAVTGALFARVGPDSPTRLLGVRPYVKPQFVGSSRADEESAHATRTREYFTCAAMRAE